MAGGIGSKLLQWLNSNMSLLALASCTLAINLLMTLFNFYYVKVFLQRYHISSYWLSAAQMVYMICNFVIGPLIAYGLDYGFVFLRNRRRLVLLTGPMLAIVFLFPWFPLYEITHAADPDNWGPGLHLMLVLILWNILFSIVSSCNNGLFAEMSTDENKRVKALTFNQVAALFAASAVFPVDALSKSVRDFQTFQICCGLAGLIAMAAFIFTGLKASDVVAQTGGARCDSECEQLGDKEKAVETKVDLITVDRFSNVKSYLTIVSQVLRTRNFWCAVVANFMTFFRVIVIYNFIAVYTEGLISEYLLPTGSTAIATFYLVAQVSPRVIFIMASPLIKYFGSYRALQSCLLLACLNSAAGIFLGMLVGYNSLVAFLLLESILVAFQDLFVIFYSEVVDTDVRRYKRKLPASTVIFALTGLFIQPSTAMAPMVVVRALNIGGYEEYKADIRSAPPYTKQVMFLVATCVPAAASIVSFVSMSFYKKERPETKRDVITRL